jgi:hypothetical protein
MKTSKIILGGLAGTVTFFLLGWLVYGILLSDFTATNFNNCAARPEGEMIWTAIILSNLFMGFLVALAIDRTKVKTTLEGVFLSAALGLMIAAAMDFSMYSMSTTFLNSKAVIVDIALGTLLYAIAGFIESLVMLSGKKKK